MSAPNSVRIRRIYDLLVSIMIVVSGICLIIACVDIYRSGEKPFSPEAVAIHFRSISVVVYVCLALIVGSIPLHLLLPAEEKKKPLQKQYSLILQRLHQTIDLSVCDSSVSCTIQKQSSSRKLHSIITLALLLVCSVVFLIYACNPSNFHEKQINASMVRAMYILIPCFVIPFGYAVFTAYYSKASIRKEIDLLKASGGVKRAAVQVTKPSADPKWQAILRWVLICLAVAIVIYGYVSGGTADVLTKAVNICTECVGLG